MLGLGTAKHRQPTHSTAGHKLRLPWHQVTRVLPLPALWLEMLELYIFFSKQMPYLRSNTLKGLS